MADEPDDQAELEHDWSEVFAMPELGWMLVRECYDCGAIERLD